MGDKNHWKNNLSLEGVYISLRIPLIIRRNHIAFELNLNPYTKSFQTIDILWLSQGSAYSNVICVNNVGIHTHSFMFICPQGLCIFCMSLFTVILSCKISKFFCIPKSRTRQSSFFYMANKCLFHTTSDIKKNTEWYCSLWVKTVLSWYFRHYRFEFWITFDPAELFQ